MKGVRDKLDYENLTDKETKRFQYIQAQLQSHWEESKMYFSTDNIVGLFLQGSQNYDLDTPSSDVDTKLVVTPSLSDIIMNRNAVSTTHIRANDEHIDFKDIRLMLQTFRKQNLNFLEILFTDFYRLNDLYKDSWNELTKYRERVAHYNIYAAVKAMKGVALEKYHAMEHPYPSKIDILAKYGYDPKQLHHLLRVDDYLKRYIAGEPYENCLHPDENMSEYLIRVKLGAYGLERAREVADGAIQHIDEMCAPYTKDSKYNKDDPFVDELLDSVQEQIMTKSIKQEL